MAVNLLLQDYKIAKLSHSCIMQLLPHILAFDSNTKFLKVYAKKQNRYKLAQWLKTLGKSQHMFEISTYRQIYRVYLCKTLRTLVFLGQCSELRSNSQITLDWPFNQNSHCQVEINSSFLSSRSLFNLIQLKTFRKEEPRKAKTFNSAKSSMGRD